ncbi:hypothetical protein AB0I81_09580 [Nonomuraea sp. NPDC050404]|uniref:hypothetical protein n=1 Tax=Nonomuraea sp. NPDC050404 TaxID=3155783 RepID=UPI0033F5CDBC
MGFSWPEVILLLGVLALVTFLISLFTVGMLESRKFRRQAELADDLRQLVQKFEQLAETTVDAQQRVADDLAELRSRTASIEQILRTVE